jgi:hypothetical protein
MYNALPLESVQVLVDVMKELEVVFSKQSQSQLAE